MGFFDRLRGKGKQKVAPPDRSTSKVVQRPLMDRLTELKEAGTDWTIKLNRRDGRKGAVDKHYKVMDIEPEDFEITISDDIGGGRYDVTFADQGTTVMLPGGDVPERYVKEIAGEPKRERKEKKETQGITLESILTTGKDTLLGTLIMRLFGGNNGSDLEKAAEVLVKLKQLVPEPEALDPMQMLDSLLGIIQKVSEQIKPPPVTTAGSGGFFDKFGESVGRGLAPVVSNLISGQGQQQLPEQAGQPGFAGTGQPQQQIPQERQQPPQSKVIEMPQPQKEDEPAIKPFAKLKAMWQDRNVPDEDLAVFAVEVIDSYVKFQMGGEIPLQYRNLLDDPGAALDLLFNLLPQVEFRDKAKLKELGVKFIEQWKAQSTVVQQEMEHVSGQQAEPGPGDGGTGSFEDDPSQDQERQEHRRPGEIHSPEHNEVPD